MTIPINQKIKMTAFFLDLALNELLMVLTSASLSRGGTGRLIHIFQISFNPSTTPPQFPLH